MRSACSVLLVFAVATWSVPIAAQNKDLAPIMTAVTSWGRDLSRTPQVGQPDAKTDPREMSWSVPSLDPGVEITVTVRDSQPTKRIFVAADDLTVSVLNLDDPALSPVTKRALRDVAKTYPQHLLSLEPNTSHQIGKVRVGSDGTVFVGAQAVGNLRQIVERIPGGDVTEIKIEKLKGNALPGALIGLLGGIGLGAWRAKNVQRPGEINFGSCITHDVVLIPFLTTAGGAIVGAYVWRNKTEDIIYRAPAASPTAANLAGFAPASRASER